MSESSEDVGLITVLLQRLETQRLPRALALKDKVDRGELLDDFDLGFLEEVFADASRIRPFLAQHPEYQDLAARMMLLYKEITEKALQNEKAAHLAMMIYRESDKPSAVLNGEPVIRFSFTFECFAIRLSRCLQQKSF